jgi:regulator of sirC expression with transglutaminase-like and TPR domain
VEPAARWRQLMQSPEEELPLDEAALLIAAHANPGLDVPAQLRRLDGVAARVRESDASAVCQALFQDLGLSGDRDGYDNPLNSYIDRVLDRRLGIPISLSVVLIEVGRRCGVELEGVGMPGHFLVRDPKVPHLLIDAFSGGQRLDSSACDRLYRALTGSQAGLSPDMLAATGPRAILARMLANLDRSFERRADRGSLLWVSTMRQWIPDLPSGDRVHLAARLGTLGRFADAANVLENLAEAQQAPEVAARLRSEATSLRARLN